MSHETAILKLKQLGDFFDDLNAMLDGLEEKMTKKAA